MGNGALFRTGSAAGPGTLEEMIESGCGINQAQGPVWLDLGRVITGSQGTLAIVTWASVKVRPIGTVSTPAYLQSDDINTLADCVSQIIRRRLGEESVLLNRKGLAQLLGVDPAATANMPQWTYLTTVRGFRFFPERYRDNQLADMADIAGGFGLAVQDSLLGLSNERIAAVLCGSSDKGAYWRQRNGKEILDLFFLSTMDKIGFYSGLAEAAAEKCGLRREDLCVYAQPSQMGRNCHIEFIIQADRETAAKLEKLLGIVLLDNKAFFSRPYGSLVEKIYNRCTDQKTVMPVIKRFFDENNVMNPGRLVYDGGRQ